jgi:hypothetical protein
MTSQSPSEVRWLTAARPVTPSAPATKALFILRMMDEHLGSCEFKPPSRINRLMVESKDAQRPQPKLRRVNLYQLSL